MHLTGIFLGCIALGSLGCATATGPVTFQAGDAIVVEGNCLIKGDGWTISGDRCVWTGPMSETFARFGVEIVGGVVGGLITGGNPAGIVGGAALGSVLKEVFTEDEEIEVVEE